MTAVEIRYEPRGAARDLFAFTGNEVCIAGSAGTGKSVAALYKVFVTCLKVPNTRALIVRQTHASLTSTTLITFESKIATEALALGVVKWFGGSSRQPPAYRFSNGSTIVVGGLDRPEKFLSAELDIIFCDEATEMTVNAFETLVSRIRGTALRNKQIILACNPAHPTHWIKQRCDHGTMTMLVSKHADNPAYVNADGSYTDAGRDYMTKLDALTGVRRLRLRDGIWAAAEGVIYDGWDPDLHHIPPFVIPDSWTRWWGVDFGFTNPFVCGWWAEDPDGRLYLYREIYRTQRLVEDHARDILLQVTRPVGEVPDRAVLTAHDIREDVKRGLREWTEPRPRAIVRDHDAEDAATLERHLGIATTPAQKSVKTGIEAVAARLKVAGDGRPRLFVMQGSLVERDEKLVERKLPTCTADEFPGYIWNPAKAKGEEPLKENDHGLDKTRYVVAELDNGGRPRVRFMGG